MRALTHLLFLVLAAIAGITFWWLDTLREVDIAGDGAARPRHEPEHYFERFRVRAHDDAGEPRYVLEGSRLVQYADDRSAEITEPRLRHVRPDQAPWRVRSAQGRIGPAGNRIELAGNVVLRREPAGDPPLVIETARMTVLTDAARADTDRPVTARQPGMRIAATGMTAWFDSGRVELHADVRGVYDPALAEDG